VVLVPDLQLLLPVAGDLLLLRGLLHTGIVLPLLLNA
jgi:hypothetical protein